MLLKFHFPPAASSLEQFESAWCQSSPSLGCHKCMANSLTSSDTVEPRPNRQVETQRCEKIHNGHQFFNTNLKTQQVKMQKSAKKHQNNNCPVTVVCDARSHLTRHAGQFAVEAGLLVVGQRGTADGTKA